MPRQTWKYAEDRLAAFFGTARRPLSGMNHGTGQRDDGLHPLLFLESKHGKRLPLFPLYRETKMKADREKRVPVIGLQEKGRHGILLVIHSGDFEEVARAWADVNGLVLSPKEERPAKKKVKHAKKKKRSRQRQSGNI